jgi:DNA-binding NarL/FixJ family response regulator
MSKAKIFLVEDHPITRQGLAQLIESQADMTVCGWAEDSVEAMSGIEKTSPDLVISDLTLKGTDGLELLKQLRPKHPHLHVLIISMHDEFLYAQRALLAGARGYVMKAEAPEKLLLAVRRVLAGEIYLSEKESARALTRLARGSSPMAKSPLEQLSDRELEVFRWIGRGCSLQEIATRLQISVKTVETHCTHIKTKLDISNSRELNRQAFLWFGQMEGGQAEPGTSGNS